MSRERPSVNAAVLNSKNNNDIIRTVKFAVSADHRVKLKESEKNHKYLNFAWELKKLWNMKVTILPIVIGPLGTAIKGFMQGLEGLKKIRRVGTIKITALLRSTRIQRRVLET